MTACGQPPLCSWLKAKLFCEAGRTGLAAYFPKPAITAAAMAANWAALHLPCKGLLAARASARTEFYFTCIARPGPQAGSRCVNRAFRL